MNEKELVEKIAKEIFITVGKEQKSWSHQMAQDLLKALRQIPPEELCKVSQCDYFYVKGTKSVDYYHELQWRKLG